MNESPRRLARKTIYENPWVSLYVDRVEFPGGRVIPEHHVIHFDRESVAVLVENAVGDVLLIESHRYVVGNLQWEIPAGRIDAGESVIEAARRETLEESGYESSEHRILYRYHALNGISNIVHHIVYCRAQTQVSTFDTNEVRSVRWVSAAEIERMLGRAEIEDGYTLISLLMWLRMR